MYKLLASDIDDTLLAPDGSMPDKTRHALELLHKNGVAVVLSSGRATASMRPIASRIMNLADDEYLISFNGGRVVTARSDTIIFEQAILPEVLKELMDYCREEEVHAHGYDVTGFVVQEGATENLRYTEMYARTAELPYRRVQSMAFSLPGGSIKLLLIGDPQVLAGHQKELLRRSRGRYSTVFSKPHYLEIVAAGVSKGHALEMLAHRLEIPLEECMALGDSTNDIEMIERAGLGVAVANARQELIDRADVVLSRSAAEAALVELVERFFPDIAFQL